MTPADVDRADQVDALLAELYGADADALATATGVVHVAAVWQAPPDQQADRYVTMAICDDAPQSAHDAFALAAARARADAIVTTGRILRAEPALSHELRRPALAAWRRERLVKTAPPLLAVLTSGRDLPLDHPALGAAGTPVIYTDRAGAARLAAPPRVDVVAVARPDLRGLIAHLRADRGCRTILIEAGPSTATALYEPPVAVDELLLSVFLGQSLPARARARDFVAPARVRACLPGRTTGRDAAEPSGPWRFWRFTRGP